MTDQPPGLEGFESLTTDIGAVSLHHVRGGAGPAMLLVHGFPQDWFEWRRMMPRLAESSTVVAVDVRGVGGSDATADGYDAATLATDLHHLVERLGLGPVDIVGHDTGGWIAYAYARLFPSTTSSVTTVETLIPGVEPFASAKVDAPMWHGEFHMVPGLAEALVADRQAIYFRYFFDVGTRAAGVISDADLEHYAAAYGDAAHLRAGFEVYRAIPADVAFNDEQRGPIEVPLLLVGGEHVFGPSLDAVATNLRENYGWSDVAVHVVPDGQHYLMEERPDDMLAVIAAHVGRARRR